MKCDKQLQLPLQNIVSNWLAVIPWSPWYTITSTSLQSTIEVVVFNSTVWQLGKILFDQCNVASLTQQRTREVSQPACFLQVSSWIYAPYTQDSQSARKSRQDLAQSGFETVKSSELCAHLLRAISNLICCNRKQL